MNFIGAFIRKIETGPSTISTEQSAQEPIGGSVADELIRRARVPVLLVRPRDQASGMIPGPVVDNVLILLDGSALAEQVFAPALELARVMEARCSLLRVVESQSARADHQHARGF